MPSGGSRRGSGFGLFGFNDVVLTRKIGAGAKQNVDDLGGNRLAGEITLELMTSSGGKAEPLVRGLDAFGDDPPGRSWDHAGTVQGKCLAAQNRAGGFTALAIESHSNTSMMATTPGRKVPKRCSPGCWRLQLRVAMASPRVADDSPGPARLRPDRGAARPAYTVG
jgi:hypothetical protein